MYTNDQLPHLWAYAAGRHLVFRGRLQNRSELAGDDSSTIQGKLTENYEHQNEDENVRQQFISLSVLIEFM